MPGWREVCDCAAWHKVYPHNRRGAQCAPGETMPLRAAGAQEGRNEVSPLLRITPFPMGESRCFSRCPEDLRHLLPQIRARFAREVRNAKVSAARLPKTTRRAGSTPRGRAVQPVVGARCARKSKCSFPAAARPPQRGSGTGATPGCGRAGRRSGSCFMEAPPPEQQ